MYLPLTDLLACPVCGPDAGLILYATELRDRRVLEGALGCPQCRRQWPVRGGFADLRAASTGEDDAAGAADREEAIRIAALLGITQGPGYLLIVGPAARHAPAVADLLEHVEVVGVDPSLERHDERAGVSRIAAGHALPFIDGRVRGVWLSGPAATQSMEDGVRVLAQRGRIVLEPAPPGARERLASLGVELVAEQDATVLGARVR